jgi:hypothetical protein
MPKNVPLEVSIEEAQKTYHLNPKQARMAYYYMEHGEKTAAYVHAYGRGNYGNKSLYTRTKVAFRNPKVVAFIQDVQAEHARRHNMKVDDLLAELEEARQLAKSIEQPSPMVSATMGKAKILGLDNPKGKEEDEEQAQKLEISFEVREPLRDVKVTNGRPEVK